MDLNNISSDGGNRLEDCRVEPNYYTQLDFSSGHERNTGGESSTALQQNQSGSQTERESTNNNPNGSMAGGTEEDLTLSVHLNNELRKTKVLFAIITTVLIIVMAIALILGSIAISNSNRFAKKVVQLENQVKKNSHEQDNLSLQMQRELNALKIVDQSQIDNIGTVTTELRNLSREIIRPALLESMMDTKISTRLINEPSKLI